MAPQGRNNAGNMTALAGGILALLAFFLFPYISLGIFGSYTAVQLAGGIFGLHLPALWLELLAALVVLALAGYSWSRREGSAAWSILLVGLSGVAVLVILIMYVIQSQQRSLFGPDAAFYATGFWLYLIGLVAGLVGGIIQLRSNQLLDGGRRDY